LPPGVIRLGKRGYGSLSNQGVRALQTTIAFGESRHEAKLAGEDTTKKIYSKESYEDYKTTWKAYARWCIFQPKSTTYSDASRPPGPIHLDHPFRSKPTTDPSLKSTTFSSLPEWVVAMDRNQWSRSSESMVAMTGTADLKRR